MGLIDWIKRLVSTPGVVVTPPVPPKFPDNQALEDWYRDHRK